MCVSSVAEVLSAVRSSSTRGRIAQKRPRSSLTLPLPPTRSLIPHTSPRKAFGCLGTLALAGNQIEWPELRKLHQMHIASLQLFGNPLAEDPNCASEPVSALRLAAKQV